MKINTTQFYQEKMKQYQEEQLLEKTRIQWKNYLVQQKEGEN